MKGHKLYLGALLEVGDKAVFEHIHLGRNGVFPVVRVTDKFAFVRINDTSEFKYERTVGNFDRLVRVGGPREKFKVTFQWAFRPLPQPIVEIGEKKP